MSTIPQKIKILFLKSHLMLLIDLFFLEQLYVYCKIEWEVPRFFIGSARTHAWPPPLSTSARAVTFATVDEPVLTYPSHPKSIVCIIVHSWYYIFYGFWQMSNDMYPSSRYHKDSFTGLRILCVLLFYPSSPTNP